VESVQTKLETLMHGQQVGNKPLGAPLNLTSSRPLLVPHWTSGDVGHVAAGSDAAAKWRAPGNRAVAVVVAAAAAAAAAVVAEAYKGLRPETLDEHVCNAA